MPIVRHVFYLNSNTDKLYDANVAIPLTVKYQTLMDYARDKWMKIERKQELEIGKESEREWGVNCE